MSNSGKKVFVFPLILTVITGLLYFFITGFEFVNLDDAFLIYENPKVVAMDFSDWKIIFRDHLGTLNYKPIIIFMYKVIYYLFGNDPFYFHLTSWFFHVLNGGLLFLVARKILPDSNNILLPFFIALFWAIHPLKAESVAWASELEDVVSGFFLLLSWLSFLMASSKKGNGKYFLFLLGGISLVLAFLSKATAIVLVGLIMIPFLEKLREKKWGFSVLIGTAFIVFLVFAGIFRDKLGIINGHGTGVQPFESLPAPLADLLMMLLKTGAYILHFLFPVKLSAIYPFAEVGTTMPFFFFASIVIGILVFLFLAIGSKKFPLAQKGILIYVIALSPIFLVPVTGTNFISDRYSYIPTIGLCMVLIGVVQTIVITLQKAELFKFIAGGLCLILLVASFFRLSVWENSETLFSDIISKFPSSDTAYTARGLYYLDNGKKDLAKQDFDNAIARVPHSKNALMNRAKLFVQENQLPNALVDLNAYVSYHRDDPRGYGARGSLLAMMGRLSEAEADLKKSDEMGSFSIDAYLNLGKLYVDRGDFQKAADAYGRYLMFYPRDTKIQYLKAACEDKLGHFDLCVKHLDLALQVTPDNGRMYISRARCKLLLGRKEEAVIDARKGMSLGVEIGEDFKQRLGI